MNTCLRWGRVSRCWDYAWAVQTAREKTDQTEVKCGAIFLRENVLHSRILSVYARF